MSLLGTKVPEFQRDWRFLRDPGVRSAWEAAKDWPQLTVLHRPVLVSVASPTGSDGEWMPMDGWLAA
jgi:hypothetical protein